MPKLERILETALYVDDLARACAFYEDVFELAAMFRSETLVAYPVGEASVLLLFRRGASLVTQTLPGGTIPPHDGSGPYHFAFGVAREELPPWEERLATHGIAIEGRVRWERGGESIYFRDPDGHAVEIATRGLWAIY